MKVAKPTNNIFTNTWVLQVFNMVGIATASFLHAAQCNV